MNHDKLIIRCDQLSETIQNLLDEVNADAIEACNKAGDKASKAGAKTLRATSPVRHDGRQRKYPPGSYAKSWTVKKESGGYGTVKYTIHNAKHYQIAHLLEYGHIIAATGGRSVAIEHIKPVNDSASAQYVKDVKEMIEHG